MCISFKIGLLAKFSQTKSFPCFHSWKRMAGYLWPERWSRKVITWGSMFSLKNGIKRKEIDHWESWLMNVFHVLSMKKIFQSTWFEMKQATCVFNLTNFGSSMCVKEHSDIFLNLMIEYAVKRANSGIYVPLQGITRMAGKDDYDKTYMAEKSRKIPA